MKKINKNYVDPYVIIENLDEFEMDSEGDPLATHPLLYDGDYTRTIDDQLKYLNNLKDKHSVYKDLKIELTWDYKEYWYTYRFELKGIPKDPEMYKILYEKDKKK